MTVIRMRLAATLLLSAGLLLGACDSFNPDPGSTDPKPDALERARAQQGSLFGGALTLGGDGNATGGGPAIAVNSYLWRASLDTISFFPMAQVDAFGGVIITDWYTPPQSKGERFKITVYILDRALRSDGVRANVFRQELNASGQWVDAAVEPKLGKDLEDAILTRARQIRIQQTAS